MPSKATTTIVSSIAVTNTAASAGTFTLGLDAVLFADAVLAGGIRRAALISLFSADDFSASLQFGGCDS